jgi:hypothetical protein
MKKKMGNRLCILVGLLLIAFPIRAVFAQSGNQGTLTVTVQDKTGGIVPGAKLVLTDVATEDVRRGTILSSGTYSFPALNAGTYKLTVAKTGYKDTVYEAVVIHASRVTDLTAVLEVGAVTENIVIKADQTPLVESTSNVIGQTIDLKEIEFLPLADRDPTALLNFIAGAADGMFDNAPGQAQVSSIDGIISQSSRGKSGGNMNLGAAAATPRIQNIEEITVQTSGLEANQGYGQGAMQSVLATRRGTNQYHGRVFANLQNSSFNAYSWMEKFNLAVEKQNPTGPIIDTKPLYHKNDFGGSVGGRVIKDKLFFFGAYEQDSIPGKGTATNSFMTPSLQAGNYTYFGTDGAPHVVNLFDVAKAGGLPSSLDSGIAGELSKINSSLSLGTAGNVGLADKYESQDVKQLTFQEPDDQYYYYPTFRVDYNATQSLRAHLAFNEQKTSQPTNLLPSFPGSNFSWMQDGSKAAAYTAALGVDWVIRPTLINQFQGGYLYNYNDTAYKSRAGNYNTNHDIVWWNAPWGLNIGSAGASGDFFYSGISSFYPLFSFTDNLSWQHKTHNITVGGSFYREQDHYWNPPQGYDNVVMGMGGNDPGFSVFSSTNPALATANGTQIGEMQSYYAVLSGDLLTVAGSHPLNPQTHTFSKYGALNLDELQEAAGLYFQDSWRARPNLTLNYGLRWDFTGDDHDLNSVYYSPNVAGVWGPSGYDNQFNPGSFQGEADPSYYTHSHAYAPWKVSPQPNIGFAWTPLVSEGILGKLVGGSDTVIRGGYSLRRYTPQYQDFWSYASDYGSFFYQNYSESAANSSAVGLYPGGSQHYANYLAGSFPTNDLITPLSYSSTVTEASQALTGAPIVAMNPHIQQPYIQSWNLGIQRKLGASNAIEIRYVGNRGIHAWMALNPNEVNIFENGFLTQFKSAQQTLKKNGGNSFQGAAGATPIFDEAFSDNLTGGYTNGAFIYDLQHGQVGTMAANIATPGGATSNYYCNLVPTTFTPCAANAGYGGSGGTYPINLFQANPYAMMPWDTAGASTGYLTGAGYSNYNSLQIEFRQENWHGMHFNANYTWGRALGLTSQYTLRNLRLAYGPTGADIHQALNVLGTYDLPFGKGKSLLSGNGLLDRAVGGWTLGTTNQLTSGAPFQMAGGNQTFNNLFDGGIALIGVTNKQLQKAIGYHKADSVGYADYWIDPKYISASGRSNENYLRPNTAPGTEGTRYWLYGTRYWKPNLSVSKSVALHNEKRFSLQSEFLDVFNHPRRSVGDAGLQDGSFGQTFGKSADNTTLTYLTYGRLIEIRANFEF